ncbi:hypothetical protein QR680_003642 [Steinernema hermaphroditum]|uniref:RNA polymerase Rpb4/RPC9 core domain-containing protein n=1 Tax=Steinernema hermaphroditum TaxID=289476 RepID=A0AA39HN94_9BILA|nr:hypothetical protein QR680_003642 [Steinernema hermaphroditum]
MSNKICAGGGHENPDAVDGNAEELIFPQEFRRGPNCEVLLTSEVHLLLEHRHEKALQKDEIEELSEVQQKCLDYVRRMSKFKNRESIKNARSVFSACPFHPFEIAQLVNLCPESAEEAKALIPSLEGRIGDAELEAMLNEMHKRRSYQ